MKNLLVPVDFSDVTDRVISSAEQMARALSANVLLVHCASDPLTIASYGGEVPIIMTSPELSAEERFPEQKRLLAKLTMGLRNKGINVESLLVVGSPTNEILALADEHEVEMIIMGSHGHGALYELMVGTVTKSVLHHTSHAVLIIPSEAPKETKAVPAEQWEEPVATPY